LHGKVIVQVFDVVSIQYPFPATAVKVEVVTIVDCHDVPVSMVVDPPKDTDEPLIVIAEFANLAFVTEPSGKVTVEFDVSKVTPVGTVTVSPDSPRFILVPDCGTTLSTSILLII
jgi:hypothetical protein